MKSRNPSYVHKYWFARGWGDVCEWAARCEESGEDLSKDDYYNPPETELIAYYQDLLDINIFEEYDSGRGAAETFWEL